jgi:hypothetical protein
MNQHENQTCFKSGNRPLRVVPLLPILLLPVLLLLFPACDRGDPGDIRLKDLDEGEYRYVSRIVILERAKAVALVDRPTGDALLDSLAAAWGDSARAETTAGIPSEPARAQQVGRLLGRILEAELDSLLSSPRPDRLAAPLPDPDPAELKAQSEGS